MKIRNVHESDYSYIITRINQWWGGRQMSDMLPRLFFSHFQETSFVIEDHDRIIAFVIGFISQTHPKEAYIHFVGVHPDGRKKGYAKKLYHHFFETVKQRGCSIVKCVTSPVNKASIAYHTKLGFDILESDIKIEGISVHKDYDGPDQDRVVFQKILSTT
ncbi:MULTISPECIES: GNAT family N-acetyltransferase [Aneurinibacillus]|mgnify:CR=1 FL=1|uniref:GNAT family N-acetyltransferase n=1 Tax=Aneurinibacillus thermoaerophilus TaxID=143495 RepID=A0ABX8YG26_ANETH|nr:MULTISPECIES: GNAT family N-acetyltransferase [Aneurinibacillus]MED0674398.1 GNAT family N-acetyltransferase [Aneurinibacillus thermoaerophilus]MED0678416.1 GNAT family N-acetyltransferase [Aneurinibacillus thermoaerophilus]MED0736059.1 GNAT family N-acetyltransferase [Aneurinibacillus thermoaerophilus]MED0765557.1 GNAT family N-acetyltransferase [Aneurinibacillus thermoaerophilus]QYY44270.1 GNAT family N-acetyltransferase [Aneurinibacillus thermoaerophilus]